MKPLIKNVLLIASLSVAGPAQAGDAKPSNEVPLPRFDSVEEQLSEAMEAYYAAGQIGADAIDPGSQAHKAMSLFKPLAKAGCAQAQYMLSRFYAWRDRRKTVRWARKAAEQGHAGGQYLIALEYQDESETTDYPARAHDKAIPWLRRAAEQGHARAMGELAHNRLYHGLGVERSLVSAYKWQSLIIPRLPPASSGGEPLYFGRDFWRKALEKRSGNMTEKQVAEAKRRAKEWEEKHDSIRHYPADAEPPHRFWYKRVEGGCDR